MMTKIFCIGLNKTGTSSLHGAFKYLGLRSVHWKGEDGINIKHQIEKNFLTGAGILDGLAEYDAYSDWEMGKTAQQIFIEFDKQYPNSKFILNTRPKEDWLNSREKHVKRNQQEMESDPNAGHLWLTIDREGWGRNYDRHHKVILEYFKDREQDLLVMDVSNGDGWEKLCPFLGLPIPECPFPNENAAPK